MLRLDDSLYNEMATHVPSVHVFMFILDMTHGFAFQHGVVEVGEQGMQEFPNVDRQFVHTVQTRNTYHGGYAGHAVRGCRSKGGFYWKTFAKK